MDKLTYVELEKIIQKADEYYDNEYYREAKIALGALYYEGKRKSIEQEYQTRFRIILKDIKQGKTEAQNKLGFMYFRGEGIKRNLKKALKLYKEASEQGNRVAKAALVDTDANRDYQEALRHIKEMADSRNQKAKDLLTDEF
jgi:TPR repeat protein